MKLTKESLKKIIKEELEAVMNEAELDEGMGPDHPDYDMIGGIIQRCSHVCSHEGSRY